MDLNDYITTEGQIFEYDGTTDNRWELGSDGGGFIMIGDHLATSNAISYFGPGGSYGYGAADYISCQAPMPMAGTLKNMRLRTRVTTAAVGTSALSRWERWLYRIMRYRYFIVVISGIIVWHNLFAVTYYIFSTEVKDSGIQSTEGVRAGGAYKFTVSTSGNYKILTAWFGWLPGETSQSSQEIIRTQIKGVELQGFIPSPLKYINQFTVSTSGDYRVLTARTEDGQTGDILKTRIKGQAAQGTGVLNGIDEFVTNEDGNWRELGVVEGFATELVSWDCMYSAGTVRCIWITEGEFDTEKWGLYKKIEGEPYAPIYECLPQMSGYYEVIDSVITGGATYYYRLAELCDSDTTWHGERKVKIPQRMKVPFSLSVMPSVGKSSFKIKYSVPGILGSGSKLVSLRIYDSAGRLVKQLIEEEKRVGSYQIFWDCAGVGKGTYFVRLNIDGAEVEKIVIVG